MSTPSPVSAPDALQELHDELYRAQRTERVEVLMDSIGKARLLLARYRDSLAKQAVPSVVSGVEKDGTAAWEYENSCGRKFLTYENPNHWHPHDREGFQNFRALGYLAAPVAALAARETAPTQTPSAWPKDLPIRIQVSYSPGDWDTFIYGVSGHLTMEALTEIDAAIRDDNAESLFDKGPGDYLFSAARFNGQYGPEGRCELPPGWELSIEGFVAQDAPLETGGGDAR